MGIEPETYPRLCHLCKPGEITTEAEYKSNMLMVDLLAGHELNQDQSKYLLEISNHIEKYEKIHYPINTNRLIVIRKILDNKIEILAEEGHKVGDMVTIDESIYELIKKDSDVFICKKQESVFNVKVSASEEDKEQGIMRVKVEGKGENNG